MITSLPMAPAVRFHLSLNVADLHRAVDFYRLLFDREPAKQRADYAKFELDDPPLVLSLEPSTPAGRGALNHLGFRLTDMRSLVALQERLERAGLRTQREAGVECCYARQTKFWLTDPDNNLWELYILEGDIDHRGAGQAPEAVLPQPGTSGIEWEHRLGEQVPETLPLASGTAAEVRLRGTLNQKLPPAVKQRLVAEVARVLKPGGRLFVHVLVGERPLDRSPDLPGPAAAVQCVPAEREPHELLEHAGFTRKELLKLSKEPCFVRDGLAMREMQLAAWKE